MTARISQHSVLVLTQEDNPSVVQASQHSVQVLTKAPNPQRTQIAQHSVLVLTKFVDHIVYKNPIWQKIYDKNFSSLSFSPNSLWADPEHTVKLENPVFSDAAGRFPPIFLDFDTEYTVTSFNDDGEQEEEFEITEQYWFYQGDNIIYDDNFEPIENASLTFLQSGTTSPKTTYSNPSLENEVSNVAQTDENGLVPNRYFEDRYFRVIAKNQNNEFLFDVDVGS